ncbi:nuclear transport factor 2 family protein [Amycolatopsis rubida]|uniref:Nuclear transport factor 2 family protein n=1 Tax=Amycolatopsis rubida TaxID=112413 RepID=A0ABX0BTC8_9PSEU|nr:MULTISPECIES: nuclear transport factor 2 family protein [Amycolatopsis]MYW93810.1 hypothetical protein [Amycolatopsis rubida]NEC58800.1 nuclear transport factor 2 family protein [Amycolatopsis rubida]OAP23002.1 SnoaL-like domain protein [Amycolatopsis sp. M39]
MPTDNLEPAVAKAVERWAVALRENDIEAHLACFAPDVRITDAAEIFNAADRDILRTSLTSWYEQFEHDGLEVHTCFSGSGRTAVQWRLSGQARTNNGEATRDAVVGAHFSILGLNVFRYSADMRISELGAYGDTALLRRQISRSTR